jgi:hypothetical protein
VQYATFASVNNGGEALGFDENQKGNITQKAWEPMDCINILSYLSGYFHKNMT